MVVAAVVIGIIAATTAFTYMRGIKQDAYSGAKLTPVWVVKKDVPKGLPGAQAISQQYVAKSDMPNEYRPGTALQDIADIKNKVSLYQLSPGTVVVSGMFLDPAEAQVTTAERVEPGQVAISFQFDQVRAVGGHLTPGDKVDIFVTGKVDGKDNTSFSLLGYQNAKIMAIGAKMAAQAGDASTQKSGQAAAAGDAGVITFSVPVAAAQRMILWSGSAGNATMYLGLVPPDNAVIDRPQMMTTEAYLDNIPTKTPYPEQG